MTPEMKRNRTPFAAMLERMLCHAEFEKIEGFAPSDLAIILDSIANLFFFEKSQRPAATGSGIEGFAERAKTVEVDFSAETRFLEVTFDRVSGRRTIFLPDRGESVSQKDDRAEGALKAFDSLDAIRMYQLALQIFQCLGNRTLAELAKKHDPYHRETQELEKRLLKNKKRSKKNND